MSPFLTLGSQPPAPHRLPQTFEVYPDVGVAASLENQWGEDVRFRIASLSDRAPLTGDEDLVIVAAPDPPGQAACMQLHTCAPPDTPLVLFNPRLASGAPSLLLLRLAACSVTGLRRAALRRAHWQSTRAARC